MTQPAQIVAFSGHTCLGRGAPLDVVASIKAAADADAPLLIFDAVTSRPIEIDLRGTVADVRKRLAAQTAIPGDEAEDQPAPRGPGRPKLGVVAREVTLLPRHWDWLAQQPGGASVALRKLVEDARRAGADKSRMREAQESLHRFMTAIAGDFPHYEDALRALYAADRRRFESAVAEWPADVRDHVKLLAADAFAAA